MAIKDSKEVFIYSDSGQLLKKYSSINRASVKTSTPMSTIINTIDKRETNLKKRTVRSKRIFSDHFNCYIFIKSYELVVNRKIMGL